MAEMQLKMLQSQMAMLKPLIDSMLAKIGAEMEPIVLYDHEQPSVVIFGYALAFQDPNIAYQVFKKLAEGGEAIAEERKPKR